MWDNQKNPGENPEKKYLRDLFLSEMVFLNDIIAIPKSVDHSKSKKEKFDEISQLLNQINKQLPSFVYIPSEGSHSLLT